MGKGGDSHFEETSTTGASQAVRPKTLKSITLEELSTHRTPEDGK